MTSMATCCGGGRYYIEFKTDNPEAYKTVQEICRLYIDREKLTKTLFKLTNKIKYVKMVYIGLCLYALFL